MHHERIAEALEGMLVEGDSCIVRHRDGAIQVEDVGETYSSLRGTHPELYGHLASLNERLDHATGCLWMLVMLAVAVAGCFAVRAYVPDLAAWWVYVGILLAAGAIWNGVDDWLAARIYERFRDDLQSALGRAKFTRDRLVAVLIDDEHTSRVIGLLKRDPDPRL